MVKKLYNLKEVEFYGQAYKTENRIIRNHNNIGILILPKRFIGKKFNVLLIPKDD